MKITTTIERFDKNKFDVGAIYFVEMEIAEMNASCTGLYVCTEVVETRDSVILHPITIFGAQNWTHTCINASVSITSDNYDVVVNINRVRLSGSYFRDKDGVPHFTTELNIVD